MSIADELRASFKKGSILTKLIYINAGLFIPLWFIDLFFPDLILWLAVPVSFGELLFRPWTLITYMFVHVSFLHMLFNVLWLFWFGKLFMQFMHGKQLLAVYLLGGIFGGLIHLIANTFLPVAAPAIGASAAVMAIVLAVATFKPDYQLYLMFVGPVKIKYLAMIAVALDLMGTASNLRAGMGDGVAHFAHLGGALYGLWFGYEMKKGKDITRQFNNFLDSLATIFTSSKADRKRSKMKVVSKNTNKRTRKRQRPGRDAQDVDWEYNEKKFAEEAELNRILEKISQDGYSALTEREKKFLFEQKDK